MRKKKQDRRWRNAGTSMVEVMIAFLIVMLLMAMFTRYVTTPSAFEPFQVNDERLRH